MVVIYHISQRLTSIFLLNVSSEYLNHIQINLSELIDEELHDQLKFPKQAKYKYLGLTFHRGMKWTKDHEAGFTCYTN